LKGKCIFTLTLILFFEIRKQSQQLFRNHDLMSQQNCILNDMIIPYSELSEEALQALIEDFVTRDGTDYGLDELSMQEKATHLLALLKTGKLLITYNEDTQTCGLVTKEEIKK
jgi:uncharacterized protein YheU (UPF0270 family)